jgi:hypothetical protein
VARTKGSEVEKSMRAQSVNECAYRGVGKRKCAIGQIISDDALARKLDRLDCTGVNRVFRLLPKSIQAAGRIFLIACQDAHDSYVAIQMPSAFKLVAERYGLKVPTR